MAYPPEPKWYTLAKTQLGVKETPGSKSNPTVVNYYEDAVNAKYADSVPWCAAFVGAMLNRAGYESSGSLMARSYTYYGEKDNRPTPGTIVVMPRGKPPSGHVAFFDRYNKNGTVRILGGNQSDAVTYTNVSKSKIIAYRWPNKLKKEESAALKKTARDKFSATTPLTWKQIMDEAKMLYNSAETISSLSTARAAAKNLAKLVYFIARNMGGTQTPAAKKAPRKARENDVRDSLAIDVKKKNPKGYSVKKKLKDRSTKTQR